MRLSDDSSLMRIAVWHNLPSGGAKRALYDQVSGLLKLGHQLESWCPPSAEQEFLPLSDVIPEHIVPAEHVPSSKATNLWELAHDTHVQIEAMNGHARRCAREINEGGFDLLLAAACMEFGVTALARYCELPSVLYLQEPHRSLYEALPNPPWAADERPPGWWYSHREVRHAVRRAFQVRRNEVQVREEVRNASAFNKVACNSLYSRESILRAYGLDAEVCYLGVDESRFTPGDHGPRLPFFLSVGHAAYHKNAAFIIRALGRRADKSWPLVWAANMVDEPYVAVLTQLAQRAGIKLDLRRDVSDHQLLQLYRTAGLFLYAPRLEPFGLAPLEASACGLWTVGAAEAGTRESIVDGQNGSLVAPDEEAFAQKIDELLADSAKLSAMGALARQAVQRNWGMERAVLRLEDLLRRVTNSSLRTKCTSNL
jgi:glycosyltransferase involved in cell wall biosynthesis